MHHSRLGFGEGTITSTAQRLAEARLELRRLGQELQGEVDQLQGKFGGEAARAFGALNRAWDERHGAIVTTLDRFESSLNDTEKSMRASDEQSASSISAIWARLERG